MSRPCPARDSNSPPIPPPTNTSSSMQYFSRHERTSPPQGPHTRPRAHSPSAASRVEFPSQPTTYEPHTVLHASPTESTSSHRTRSHTRSGRGGDSPSSSSQGDLVDTDVDSGPPSQHDQPTGHQTSGQPVKKKRTRTLTTPHQAVVLHALLAQSRFPTTAMREEVGRQIGLSARKVQIWFQNQRQKARRPHGHNAAPQRLDRPPQFGAFPSAAMPAPHSENPQGTLFALADTYCPWPYPQSVGPGSQQLESTSRPSTSDSIRGGLAMLDCQFSQQTLSPIERQSPYSRHLIAEASSHNESRIPRERHEMFILPPLSNGPYVPNARSAPGRESTSFRSDLIQGPSSPVDRPVDLTLPSIHSASASMLHSVPPPFTLEPRPHWQPDPTLPVGPAWRGSNLIRSRGPFSSTHNQPSTSSLRADRIENERSHQSSRAPPTSNSPVQSGSQRFDPIRSSSSEETLFSSIRPTSPQQHPGHIHSGTRRYSTD